MSYYKKNFPSKTPLPNSNLLKDTVLSLPIYPTMTLKQIKYVVSQIN